MNREQHNIIKRLVAGVIVVIFLTSPLMALNSSKNKTIKVPLDTFFVNTSIADLSKRLKDEEKKKSKLSVPLLMSFGGKFTRFSKHPDIEKETKIYRSWYSNIGKLCTAMGNLKYRYYAVKANQDTELIQEYGTKYIEYRTKCIKLLENPPKIKKNQPRRR